MGVTLIVDTKAANKHSSRITFRTEWYLCFTFFFFFLFVSFCASVSGVFLVFFLLSLSHVSVFLSLVRFCVAVS